MKRTITTLVAVALAAVACGGAGDSSDTTVAGNSDTVLLTITSEGGFIPVEFNLDRMPRYQLMTDGTLFYQGPVPAIFPGPMLTNVQVTSLDTAVRDEVLALVEELGLPGIDEQIDNSGAETIADASTEFVTYYDETGTHRLGVYALGLTDGVDRSPERLLMTELVEILDEATATGESTAYQPEVLQVAAGPGVAEPGMSTVEPWPLEMTFSDMDEWGAGWRCSSVEGEVVDSLIQVFSEANQATLWDTGSEELALRARPLLPGETACGGAPQG